MCYFVGFICKVRFYRNSDAPTAISKGSVSPNLMKTIVQRRPNCPLTVPYYYYYSPNCPLIVTQPLPYAALLYSTLFFALNMQGASLHRIAASCRGSAYCTTGPWKSPTHANERPGTQPKLLTCVCVHGHVIDKNRLLNYETSRATSLGMCTGSCNHDENWRRKDV